MTAWWLHKSHVLRSICLTHNHDDPAKLENKGTLLVSLISLQKQNIDYMYY